MRLRTVLRRIGLDPSAVSIMATGLDAKYVSGGVDYGPVRRPFPVSKALDDALLVWGADGRELLPDHGYPIRLVLPGWVGIGSIKWLGSLEVSTTEQTSPWNTTWYRMSGGNYPPDSPPLTVNPVRSAFELAWGEQLVRRHVVTVTGRSWSGAGQIARVDVSTDGGTTWDRVHESRCERSGGWTQWSYEWHRPAPVTMCSWPGRRTSRVGSSRWSRRTTPTGTSSTRWCGIRSPSCDSGRPPEWPVGVPVGRTTPSARRALRHGTASCEVGSSA